MTDTKAPSRPWLEALKLVAPSLNTCLIAIVTAVISGAGSWFVATRQATPAPAPTIATVRTVPENGSLMSRLKALEDHMEEQKRLEAERPKVKVIRPAKKQQG